MVDTPDPMIGAPSGPPLSALPERFGAAPSGARTSSGWPAGGPCPFGGPPRWPATTSLQ